MLALVVAFLVTSAILLALGDPVVEVWQTILSWPKPRQIVNIVNGATVFYLSAIAVAVGFRMNLFNIGVDGQYRVARLRRGGRSPARPGSPARSTSSLIDHRRDGRRRPLGEHRRLPQGPRGVSEVICTIMLNAIATGVVAVAAAQGRGRAGRAATRSRPSPSPSRPARGPRPHPGRDNKVYTLILLAVLVGVLYWFVLNKTRFGFDLRATGRSESAAVASGVKVPRMVVTR